MTAEANAAAVRAYRDRVGMRVLTGPVIDTFAKFTYACAEKRTPCYATPDLFFNPNTVNEAKQACAKCPLRDACLNFALDAHQVDGVWGGLAEDERAAIRKARRAHKQKQWKRQREARAAAAQSEPLFQIGA